MPQFPEFHDLYAHMNWADAATWRAVLACPQAETDPRLRDLCYHLHATQHAFLQIWSGVPIAIPEPATFANLTAIAQWGFEYHQKATAYLDSIDESRFAQPVAIPWAKRVAAKIGKTPATATLAETMLQVVLHSTHHRGQATVHLREIGGEPHQTDFIAWVWLGKPAAEWPRY